MAKRPILTRGCTTKFEVRGAEGRTVFGLACSFDTPTEVNDRAGRYVETFRKGAVARTIAERGPAKVKFLAQHDRRGLPLGGTVRLAVASAAGPLGMAV